jgi:hypothetical protein
MQASQFRPARRQFLVDAQQLLILLFDLLEEVQGSVLGQLAHGPGQVFPRKRLLGRQRLFQSQRTGLTYRLNVQDTRLDAETDTGSVLRAKDSPGDLKDGRRDQVLFAGIEAEQTSELPYTLTGRQQIAPAS